MKLKVLAVLIASAAFVTSAYAQSVFTAKLAGLKETPIVISGAMGTARVTISRDEKSIEYEVTYNGLEGSVGTGKTVLFSHIHVGRPTVTGGVAVFFCGQDPKDANAVTGPHQVCPAAAGPGTSKPPVTGTLTQADITGPASQGVDPTNPNNEDSFARLVKAIKSGLSYANVHTTRSAGGEIRGQLVRARHDDDDDDDRD
jgi:hypothetical protein